MENVESSPVSGRIELAFAPLHKTALGVACGVVSAAGMFLGTIAALIYGRHSDLTILGYLGQYFSGYSMTWRGAFIGLLWGFGTGFLVGWSFALLRNFIFWVWLTLIKSRAEMEQYDDFLDHL